MATPKVRFNMDLTPEEDIIVKEMMTNSGIKKAAVFKNSLQLMKNIKDAIREGNQVMIVSANGELSQLSCL